MATPFAQPFGTSGRAWGQATSTGPASRASSLNRRDSNSACRPRRPISADRAHTYHELPAQARGVSRPTNVRRWSGNDRTSTHWDSIRKVCPLLLGFVIGPNTLDRIQSSGSPEEIASFTCILRVNPSGAPRFAYRWPILNPAIAGLCSKADAPVQSRTHHH